MCLLENRTMQQYGRVHAIMFLHHASLAGFFRAHSCGSNSSPDTRTTSHRNQGSEKRTCRFMGPRAWGGTKQLATLLNVANVKRKDLLLQPILLHDSLLAPGSLHFSTTRLLASFALQRLLGQARVRLIPTLQGSLGHL